MPLLFLPAAVLALAMGLLSRVRIGRHILAVGGNTHAAELGGVSAAQAGLWAHAISGLLAAVAGMMVVARL